MFDDDFTVFFSDFAELATVGGRSMRVIFDNPLVEFSDGFSNKISNSPQITCQSSEVVRANAFEGSPVIIRSTNYKISEIHDTGNGLTILQLYKA